MSAADCPVSTSLTRDKSYLTLFGGVSDSCGLDEVETPERLFAVERVSGVLILLEPFATTIESEDSVPTS
jgi:hypothetical protein